MKRKKRDESAVMPESVAAQPEPVRVIHILNPETHATTRTMLCGSSGDGPNEGSVFAAHATRANCPNCLATLPRILMRFVQEYTRSGPMPTREDILGPKDYRDRLTGTPE